MRWNRYPTLPNGVIRPSIALSHANDFDISAGVRLAENRCHHLEISTRCSKGFAACRHRFAGIGARIKAPLQFSMDPRHGLADYGARSCRRATSPKRTCQQVLAFG